ncbi:MAG: cytochrome-c peroxidase [Planctomycetes bacterium]|nr:cytochrome-c peroxidase [Planctomycetota bacterium]
MADPIGNVVISGRFDAIDAVPRLSPSMIGLAFNQRLLWDGAAGEPYDASDPTKANANPGNLPAAENIVQRANRAHRMLETQRFAIQSVPVYMRLFKDAFPEEFANYESTGNPDDLCNDDVIQRAIAAFLRTVVTRNTPFDSFLAGDDTALTDRQLRGAWLFSRRPIRVAPTALPVTAGRCSTKSSATNRALSSTRISITSESAIIPCRT